MRKRKRKKGEKKGEIRGKFEAKIETAKNFYKMGLSIEQIAKGTGLSIQEIQKITEEIEKQS